MKNTFPFISIVKLEHKMFIIIKIMNYAFVLLFINDYASSI